MLCSMLEAVARSKKPALKRKHLRTFLDHVYTDREYFSALRLILPSLDRERGTYGLKEAALAKCLSDALGLAKESEDAKKLLNWRKGGAQHVGNFPLVAAEVLFMRQSTSSGGLKIKDVNSYLDQLVAAENKEDKSSILAELISKTNAQEMKWIIIFILKELKLGLSEKTVFREFHPDAEDMFNVTCDLKLVCEKLKVRSQRFKRQDIQIGKPVRPQLAARVADVEEAWRKLRGKSLVIECKFDGDRIQIHKNGREIHFFSRNFIDHTEYRDAISDIICRQIKAERCILDGEMLVWNRLTNRFEEFGSNQEVAKAAREGLETEQQLCYVAFDILYAGDSSVIHQSLHERQRLLKQVVQPVKGSLELLLPENGGSQDQPCWSKVVHTAEEIQKFFLDTVENRDEGIVIKDLDSKWEPTDRSGKWIKLKPDYVHAESELDALIIGCYLGSGRRGGEVGQFLLGLADRPKIEGAHPTRFLSFCKVGTGLSDHELDVLVSKLKPYMRKYDTKAKPPSFYTVTNTANERPDFWVEQPDKSVILEITSDIRTIKSEVFATPYSLRFPRVHRVRYDKPWYDCLDVQSLIEIVTSKGGNTADLKQYGKNSRPKVSKVKKVVQLMPLVPSHMLMTDVSHVKQETSIFKGFIFYFINFQPQSSKDVLHRLVTENGGLFSMNMNSSVTHAIAAEKKGLRYQAAALNRDIIHESWVTDCCSQKALMPLKPKYILHVSKDSKMRLRDDIDEFGDGYVEELDVADLRQLFLNLDTNHFQVMKEEICQIQKKHFLTEGFGQLCDYRIYFHHPIHSTNMDSQIVAEVTLKRLALEVLMHGGEVTTQLKDASHVIIYTSVEHPVTFSNLVRSVTTEERDMLKSQELHIVKHAWLEAVFASNNKVEEEAYHLRDFDGETEGILAINNALSTEKLPAGRLCKRARSHMTGYDSSSGSDEISSRRQLYRFEKDSMVEITMDSAISGKVKKAVSQTKQRKVSKQLRRRSCSIQAGNHGVSSGEQTCVSTMKTHPLEAEDTESQQKKRDLTDDIAKSSDIQFFPENLEEMPCEGNIHLQISQGNSSNIIAEVASQKVDMTTTERKKRVSYKDLVDIFLNPQ